MKPHVPAHLVSVANDPLTSFPDLDVALEPTFQRFYKIARLLTIRRELTLHAPLILPVLSP